MRALVQLGDPVRIGKEVAVFREIKSEGNIMPLELSTFCNVLGRTILL